MLSPTLFFVLGPTINNGTSTCLASQPPVTIQIDASAHCQLACPPRPTHERSHANRDGQGAWIPLVSRVCWNESTELTGRASTRDCPKAPLPPVTQPVDLCAMAAAR